MNSHKFPRMPYVEPPTVRKIKPRSFGIACNGGVMVYPMPTKMEQIRHAYKQASSSSTSTSSSSSTSTLTSNSYRYNSPVIIKQQLVDQQLLAQQYKHPTIVTVDGSDKPKPLSCFPVIN